MISTHPNLGRRARAHRRRTPSIAWENAWSRKLRQLLVRDLWWNPVKHPMSIPDFHHLVRVVKVREADQPLIRAGSWKTYMPGAVNAESLPIDYEIVGCLLTPASVGGCLHLLRMERNRIGCLGEFRSTCIRRVETDLGNDGGLLVFTVNSVYRVTPLTNGKASVEVRP